MGPVFGAASQPVVLRLATPPPGGLVMHAQGVPSTAALRNVAVWLQAFQVDAGLAFASPLAGGLVR